MIRARLGGLVVAIAACGIHRGPFVAGAPQADAGEVAIAIVGGAGAQGPAATRTAAALQRALAGAGTAVVVLPGDHAPHRRARARRARGRADARVTAAVAALPHATVLALPGAAERHRPSAVTTTAHAVVRVREGGTTEVISSCADDRCSVRDDAAPGAIDLVLLDLQPWYRAGGRADDAALARAMSLVESVARQPSRSPRVLALTLPVEGAYELGLGSNLDPIATFHLLPPALQQALVDGVFDGVVAGSERAMHLQRDLSPAIARSDKVYLRRPLWQLVSGNAADPPAGRLARRLRWVHGVALQPEYTSFAPGFAVLHLHGGPPRATLHVWRRRRWVTAAIALPRASATAGPRVLPGMTPCLRCTAVPSTDKP